MKWGIVILIILGLVAAVCAAVLMGTLSIKRPDSGEKEADTVEVVMAKRALNAGTIVTLEDISTEIITRDELPEGKLLSTLQVVGRALNLPVVEGQVLTASCLIPEGTGAILASQIPEGMRAFTVPITSRARPDNLLLYPGCVVDVLVEYKLGRGSKGEAVSTTMFRGLRVLAVFGDSVVTSHEEEDGKNSRDSKRSGLNVSLLVEPRQAEALQLAVENGSITMSLRNPLDKKSFATEGSVLNRSTILESGSTVPSTVMFESPEGYDLFSEKQGLDPNEPQEKRITPDNPTEDGVFIRQKSMPYPIKSRWQVEMIRGREKKVEEFDNPEDEAENTDTEK